MAVIICRPYITLKDGTVLWAKNFGKKAFCFPVPDKQDEEPEKPKKQ
jgi:hypothetical protein